MSRFDPVRISISDTVQFTSPNASCSPLLGAGLPNGHQPAHEEYGKSQRGSEQEACGKSSCDRKDNTWGDTATACLLDAFEEKWIGLGRGNLRCSNWEEVAIEVNLRCGVARTGDQCRHKMEKLRRKYREEKALKDRLMFSPSKWRWFERFEFMLGDKQQLQHKEAEAIVGIDSHERYAAWNMMEGVIPAMKRPSSICMEPRASVMAGHALIRNEKDGASFTSPSQWDADAKEREDPVMLKANCKVLGKGNSKRRKESNDFLLAMKVFTEGLLKIEKYKADQQKENERSRYEMELKRTELLVGMELKRTEMHLEFAKAIASMSTKKLKKVETGSNISETRDEVAGLEDGFSPHEETTEA